MLLRTIRRMTSSRYHPLQLTRSREKLSQSPLILVGMGLLLSFDFSLGLSKLLLDAFLSWPASRTQEVRSLAPCLHLYLYMQAEADHIGLLMMAEGCYRPEAAMEFWNRMENSGQKGPPQILSTHPSNHNREAKIREWLPQAHEKAASSNCHAMGNYGGPYNEKMKNCTNMMQ
jgi:hypothetical protein